jgi:hypothetical protein
VKNGEEDGDNALFSGGEELNEVNVLGLGLLLLNLGRSLVVFENLRRRRRERRVKGMSVFDRRRVYRRLTVDEEGSRLAWFEAGMNEKEG